MMPSGPYDMSGMKKALTQEAVVVIIAVLLSSVLWHRKG